MTFLSVSFKNLQDTTCKNILKISAATCIVLISIIYGLPHIILKSNLGSRYNPLNIHASSPTIYDESFYYSPFVNYIANGHLFLGDVYSYEYRDSPSPFLGETLPAQIMALLSFLTGSVPNSFVASDFIFPPIIFFLIYILSKNLIKNEYLALSAACFTSLFRDFIAVIPYPKEIIKYFNTIEGPNYFLYLSRAFHPQMTFPIFLISLIFLLKVIEQGKRLYIVAFGVSFGLLFYSYLFYWTYMSFLVLTCFLYLLYTKRFATFKRLTASVGIAFLIASYYLVNMINIYLLPNAQDFLNKSATENNSFNLVILRFALLTFLFILFFKFKDKKFFIWVFILFSATLMSSASKMILGQDLETMHYVRRILMPVSTITLFGIAFKILEGASKFTKKYVALIIIAISLTFAFSIQVRTTNKILPSFLEPNRDLNEVLSYLKANTQKSDVLATLDSDLNSIIPTYLPNKIYFPPNIRTIMTSREELERYIILSKLSGKDAGRSEANFKNLIDYIFYFAANTKEADQTIAELFSNYQNIDNKKYKMNYLIISPKEYSTLRPDLKYLKPETVVNGYIIFKSI